MLTLRGTASFLGVAASRYALAEEMQSYLKPESAAALMHSLIDFNRLNGITATTDHAMGALNFDLEARMLDRVFNHPDTPDRLILNLRADSFLDA